MEKRSTPRSTRKVVVETEAETPKSARKTPRTPKPVKKAVETEASTETDSPKSVKKSVSTPKSVKKAAETDTPKSVKKSVSTPKSVKMAAETDTPKSKSVKKSSESTPKSSRKSSKKVVVIPEVVKTPDVVPTSDVDETSDVDNVVVKNAKYAVVNFTSDDESDSIQDVEKLAHYKPVLTDIPEEDDEAHALMGKYAQNSKLLGSQGGVGTQTSGFQTPKKNQMVERTAQILQNSSASKCLTPIPARLLTPSRRNAAQAVAKVLSVKKNIIHSSASKGTTPAKGRASTEVTPVKGRHSSNVTPAKGSTAPMSARKAALNTPLRPLVLTGDEPQTPMSTRHAVKWKIEKIRCDEEEEEDSSDEETSDDDDEDDEDEENVDVSNLAKSNEMKRAKLTPPKKETPLKVNTRGRKKMAIKENPEEYFSTHSDGKIVTSDKTLNQLKTPRLSQEALRHMLSGEKLKFQSEIDELFEEYRERFPKWMLLLKENFNLLFYGLGSKRSLIHEFHLSKLSEENCIVVNGFFPSLTLKQILNSITSELLETEATFSTPSEQVDFICKNIEDCLFLIVHNIDGGMLRGEKNQSLLARLASHPKIHLISSIDHINAALMWDQQKLSQYNFVMFDATTFLPYTEETLNENSLMVKQSGNLALNSLTRVFASLTPNAKGIYIIIVKYQMESVAESGAQFYTGISFKDLYRKCRKAFLVNADLTLRAQLTEFRDHKLIRSRKGADGIEYLIIPLDNTTLQEFLEQQSAA